MLVDWLICSVGLNYQPMEMARLFHGNISSVSVEMLPPPHYLVICFCDKEEKYCRTILIQNCFIKGTIDKDIVIRF